MSKPKKSHRALVVLEHSEECGLPPEPVGMIGYDHDEDECCPFEECSEVMFDETTEGTTSSGANSAAFRSGWERVFGGKKTSQEMAN